MHALSRLIAIGAALLLAVGSIPSVGAAPAAQTAADPKTFVVGTAFSTKSLTRLAVSNRRRAWSTRRPTTRW